MVTIFQAEVVNTTSQNPNGPLAPSRVDCLRLATPVADGLFSPNNPNQPLRCVDGLDDPTEAQWKGFGALYDSGFFQYIAVDYFCEINNDDGVLDYSPPTEYEGPETIRIYDEFAQKTVTFDSEPVTHGTYSSTWSMSEGNSSAVEFELSFGGFEGPWTEAEVSRNEYPLNDPTRMPNDPVSDTISFRLDKAQAVLTDESPRGPNSGIVKSYKQTARSTQYPAFYMQVEWEEYTDMAGAQLPKIRYWMRWGNSRLVDTLDFDNLTYPEFRLTEPVVFRIKQPVSGETIVATLKRSGECVSATMEAGPDYVWKIVQPYGTPGNLETGTSYDRFTTGCTLKYTGEVWDLNAVNAGTALTIASYQSSVGEPDKIFRGVTRSWRDGDPLTGRRFRNYVGAGHLPLWSDSPDSNDESSTRIYPPSIGSDEQFFKNSCYIYKNFVETDGGGATREQQFDRDAFAHPNHASSRPDSGEGGTYAMVGNCRLWFHATAACGLLDAYIADGYKEGLAPQFWMYEDGRNWKYDDPMHLSGPRPGFPTINSNFSRREVPSRILIFKAPVAPFAGGDLMGQTNPVPRSKLKSRRVTSISNSNAPIDVDGRKKTHTRNTFLTELYLMTADRGLKDYVEVWGEWAVCNALEWVDRLASISWNVSNVFGPSNDHIERAVARNLFILTNTYLLTGDERLRDHYIRRWETVERNGNPTPQGFRTPGDPSSGARPVDNALFGSDRHNREYPDFQAGETVSPTQPITDRRHTVWAYANSIAQSQLRYLPQTCQPTGPGQPQITTSRLTSSAVRNNMIRNGAAGANLCGYNVFLSSPWMTAELCMALYHTHNVMRYPSRDVGGVIERGNIMCLEMLWLAQKIARTYMMQAQWFNQATNLWEQFEVPPPAFPYENSYSAQGEYTREADLDPRVISQGPVAPGYARTAFPHITVNDPLTWENASYYPWHAAMANLGIEWAQELGDTEWFERCVSYLSHNYTRRARDGVTGWGNYEAGYAPYYGLTHGFSNEFFRNAGLEGMVASHNFFRPVELLTSGPRTINLQSVSTVGRFKSEGGLNFDINLESTSTIGQFGSTGSLRTGSNVNLDRVSSIVGEFISSGLLSTGPNFDLAESSTTIGEFMSSGLLLTTRSVIDLSSSSVISEFGSSGRLEVDVPSGFNLSSSFLPLDRPSEVLTDRPTTTESNNISIYRGDLVVITFTLVDPDTLQPVDITGASIEYGIFSDRVDGNSILRAQAEIVDGPLGVFSVTLSQPQTRDLPKLCYHEARMDIGFRTTTILSGSVTVTDAAI